MAGDDNAPIGSRTRLKSRNANINPQSLQPASEASEKGNLGPLSTDDGLNPLTFFPILRRLFKRVHSISDLSKFRMVCRQWNEIALKMLQELSNKGQLKAIDFVPNNSWKEAEERMTSFLQDTSGNPQLFQSFDFWLADPTNPYFAKYLKRHQEFPSIFDDYAPSFLNLKISDDSFNANSQEVMMGILEKISSSVKELKIFKDSGYFRDSPTMEVTPLIFPQLTKVTINGDVSFRAFCLAFGHGGEGRSLPNITSLGLFGISYANLDDLLRISEKKMSSQLRWTNLTHLKISAFRFNNSEILRLSSHLLDLSENGMILKNFGISYILDGDLDLELVFTKIQHILEIQANSLKDLHLYFHLRHSASQESKITLPRFESLHSLSIYILNYIDGKDVPLFILESLPVNFPSLRHLEAEINSSSTWALLTQTGVSVKRLDLDSLKFYFHLFLPRTREFQWTQDLSRPLMENIRSVSFLVIPSSMIKHGEELSWGDSVKKLVLTNGTYHYWAAINFPINLRHFTKLDELVIGEDLRLKSWHLQKYLKNFKDVIGLGLSKITIHGLKIVDVSSREDFIKTFPFKVDIKEEKLQ